MDNVINSWKNNNVFKKQLELNIKELSNEQYYPSHWKAFLVLLKQNNPKSILDIGCGCGAYYALCNRELNGLIYTGMDYSEDAINLAKNYWSYNGFIVKNYLDLTKEFVNDYDLLHLGALLDVLPNGDEALEFILSLEPKNVLIGRVKLTNKPSFYETYTAYDEITTCAYYHNKENFMLSCKKYGYEIINIENNFYLKKKTNE
jgi:trans-aconitate methyltransferase